MADAVWERDLAEYDISVNGFLPGEEPLARFTDADKFDEYDSEVQEYLATLDDFYGQVPDFLENKGLDHLRFKARQLPQAPEQLYDQLGERELRRLYQGHAFAASGYIHALERETADHLPSQLAQPLFESAQRLDVPPILSYDAYSLYNWQLDDPEDGVVLGNVSTVQNFMNMSDEDWFMLVHAEIEDEAAQALHAIPSALQAVDTGSAIHLAMALANMRDATGEMVDTLARMPEGNSPDNYAHTFRHYIEAFDDVEYEGVDELEGPQSFRGETGAQSSIMPALDGAFGIPHKLHELTKHVGSMRDYMPEGHRRFIADVEDGPDITTYVEDARGAGMPGVESMADIHDSVMQNMIAFRYLHVEYARMYIEEEVHDEIGTGNTIYNKFLSEFILETEDQILKEENRRDAWIDYLEDALSETRWHELNNNLEAAGKELGETTRPDGSVMDDMPFHQE